MNLTRRKTLQFFCAAVAVAAVPAAVVAAAPEIVPEVVKRPPAWAVGTPDGWDWDVIYAETEEQAKKIWLEEKVGYSECGCSEIDQSKYQWYRERYHQDMQCEVCDNSGIEASRQPTWDDQDVKTGDHNWFAVGFGTHCGRCGSETYRDDGGHIVEGEVVCGECMELADWDIVDPDEAEELREIHGRDCTCSDSRYHSSRIRT